MSEEASVCVFAPAPWLTVTIEDRGKAEDIHLHAGGQGFWIARMVVLLGGTARQCSVFGGEPGDVARSLIGRSGITVCAVDGESTTGMYIHDRRSGDRRVVAEVAPGPLSRHELDALYSMTVVEALEASACVLAGTDPPDVVPPVTYRRLAADLTTNGVCTIADLSGEQLSCALEGGASIVKVSHEDLINGGWADDDSDRSMLKAIAQLRCEGAGEVIVSRADQPALATVGDALVELSPPTFEPVDHRGAGDSMTAAVALSVARGNDLVDCWRLGVAAGSLNVTRHGLATGRKEDIERLAARVEVRDVG